MIYLENSILPIEILLISPLIRSRSWINLFKMYGFIKHIAIHAAMCTPSELLQISIMSPTIIPIGISAHLGSMGKVNNGKMYTISTGCSSSNKYLIFTCSDTSHYIKNVYGIR